MQSFPFYKSEEMELPVKAWFLVWVLGGGDMNARSSLAGLSGRRENAHFFMLGEDWR